MLLPLLLNLGPPGAINYYKNTDGSGAIGMQKNVSSQQWVVFAFNRNTNVIVTSDALNITGNLRLDGGAANAIDDTNPTELEDGFYVFDLTQGETNADNIVMAPVSSVTNVQVIGVPMAQYTLVTGVGSNAVAISSLDSLITGLSTTTTIELKEAPEGAPRIEAGDTFQFVKNTLTDPQSVAVSITAPDSTTIVSLATATQSGTSTNWYYFHTDQNSWHTTVDSSGQFVLEWTIFRSTGNDHEKQYFEIIKTD